MRLTDAPGLWQCMDKSPKPDGWWMLAVDDEAREHGHFEEATWRAMRPADWDGVDE
ncbi:hypothetical protein ODZ83_05470 [Acaricomes phytoseiuli]|uniref:hypothetical protein n=1 Tax=Acaricomes phytoseiuli TaxID=291968 RepID=UPI0022232B42|nr:hypothetical protein [Acaricomes phytoseiuli]MCW1249640.1 hypothetical protein [Acaricomes phytoseiuli]